jgi:nucleotide-binding universal stress UspA family protein
MLLIQRILCPTDFSESAQQALELAAALARDYRAELLVCHVCAVPVAVIADGIALPMIPEDEASARARLESLQAYQPNVPLGREFLDGEPTEEILRLAEERDVDLIVMGTHGRTGVSRLLMGSIAEAVLRKATCPVLTVKSPPLT